MESKTYEINGREFRFSEDMELGSYLDLCKLLDKMGEAEIELSAIKNFIRSGTQLREFATLALIPVDDKKGDTWEDLRYIKITTLLEVIGDFFTSGGLLRAAFPDVSDLQKKAPARRDTEISDTKQ